MNLSPNFRRLGILTGGGDCPGLNAVIRAVVKTAVLQYGWAVVGIEDGFEGLILPGKTRLLMLSDVRGILPRGGTILGTTNRANPFHYEVEIEGGFSTSDVSDVVIERARQLGIDCLVAIGGDGSLRIAYELMQKGLPVFGIPKTIDNDLPHTQVTFGFDTALVTATEALDKLHTTAESHHRVIILEVMGRDTGWIALHSGISGGADVILIPEIPYRLEVVAEKINARNQRGAKFSIIVVAEGARRLDGNAIYQFGRDPGEERRLGGIGEILAREIRDSTRSNVRVTVLGHLQRGGSPSPFDRLLASRFGVMAVHQIAAGNLGNMVALQGDKIAVVPLQQAVASKKIVTLDNDIIHTALSLDICLGIDHRQISATNK